MPVVLLGKLENGGIYRNIHCVHSNHVQSGYLKVEALLRNGHRRIGVVLNEPPSPTIQETMRGMKEAVHSYKLRWHDLTISESSIRFWEDPMHGGYVLTHEVLKKSPDITGLVVDTMLGAIGALRALHECGRRCPEDVSVVTALSHAGLEEYCVPRLSSVMIAHEKLVAAALDLIGGRLSAREIVIDGELVERESIRRL